MTTAATVEACTATAPRAWTAFGARRDLELDFSDPDRPTLVSRVLQHCAAPAQTLPDVWQLTLGQRIEGLLAILEQTEPDRPLRLRLRCPACAEPLEAALEPSALMQHAGEAEGEQGIEVTIDDGRRVRLRRPTGADQRRWRRQRYADAESLVADLIQALSLSPAFDARTLSGAQRDSLSSAMEAFDRLVAFELCAVCAACGIESQHPVDLEASVLARLHARQRALLLEIHRLASHYGWTEDEVFAVSPQRRARYLALIDDEEGLP